MRLLRTNLSLAVLLAAGIAQPADARTDSPTRHSKQLFKQLFVSVNQVPPSLVTKDGRPIAVLDAREKKVYLRGHMQGAEHFDWTDYRRGMFREGRLPQDLAELAAGFGNKGVATSRPVLVCGSARDGWGEEGRVAWMLLYLGHSDVGILDGGCKTWARAGRLMVRSKTPPRRAKFKLKINKALRSELGAVKAALAPQGAAKVQLVDVRRREEYDGATPYYSARGGHMPGAFHLYWKDLLEESTGRKRGREAIRARAKAAGLDLEKPMILYCTGGVRSAEAALLLRSAGLDASNFDGSWWQYASDDSLPVVR